MEEPKNWDCVVVGAGIVGACSALQLRRLGLSVLLVDPLQPLRAASYGNAGVVSAASIFPMTGPHVHANLWRYFRGADPGLRLRYLAMPRIHSWVQSFLAHATANHREYAALALAGFTRAAWPAHERLADLLGSRDQLLHRGWLYLYRSLASFSAGEGGRRILKDHDVDYLELKRSDLSDLEPILKPSYAHALWIKEAGQVLQPGLLVERIINQFTESGGVLLRGQAERLYTDSEQQAGSTVVELSGRLEVRAKRVVIAAGAWSNQLLPKKIPFAAERGYHREFNLAAPQGLRHAIYDVERGWVVSPQTARGERVRILSGVELGLPDQSPNFSMLRSSVDSAADVLPIDRQSGLSPWWGSRPSTPDGFPVMGWMGRTSVLLAFGHGHIGLSTGPLTGEWVAEQVGRSLQGQKQEVGGRFDVSAFSPARFGL